MTHQTCGAAAKLKKEGRYMRKRKYACLFYMNIQPKSSEDVLQICRLLTTATNIANDTGYVDPDSPIPRSLIRKSVASGLLSSQSVQQRKC